MRLKSLAALGAPFFPPGVRAGGGWPEDAGLAPESEFQLQAAYSPSPLPAPLAAASLGPGAIAASAGRAAPTPAARGSLGSVVGLGCWTREPESAFLGKDPFTWPLRRLRLSSPETRHSFPGPLCPEGLGGS